MEASVGQDQAQNELLWVEDSWARTVLFENWDNLFFWQNTVSFFKGEKKKHVGKALELSQDLLDMGSVLHNTFLMS